MMPLAVAVAGSLLTGCGIHKIDFVSNRHEVQGSGKIVSEPRKVGSFSKIEVGDSFHVVFIASRTTALKIQGDDNLVPLVKTEVTDGVLKIYATSGYSSKTPIKISLTGPKLDAADVNGAAELIASGVDSQDFIADVSGAARLEVKGKIKGLEADASGASKLILNELAGGKVRLDLSGSSEVDLSGKAETLVVDASGASTGNLVDLAAKTGDVEASGACGVHVNVSHELSAKASGASRIRYRGSAKVKQQVEGAATVGSLP